MFYWLLLDEIFWKKPLIAGPINGAKKMSIVRIIIASVKGLSHKKRIDPAANRAGALLGLTVGHHFIEPQGGQIVSDIYADILIGRHAPFFAAICVAIPGFNLPLVLLVYHTRVSACLGRS